MARGRQTLTQRIALDGGKEIRKELEALGADGRRVFQRLSQAAEDTAEAGSRLNRFVADLRKRFDDPMGAPDRVHCPLLRALHGRAYGEGSLGKLSGERFVGNGYSHLPVAEADTQSIAAHARVQPEGSVTGVDISAKMLAVARRKAFRSGVDIEFRHADVLRSPFDDERFDIVTIIAVMHMVPQSLRRECLDEAWRVLRHGGRLLLIDYAGDPGKRQGLISRHGLHGRFDLYDLREPLSEVGFEEAAGGSVGWLDLHFLRGAKR